MPLSQVKTDELGIDDNYGTYYGYDETNQVDNRTQNKELSKTITQCPGCSNLKPSYGDSSNKDLIITGVFGKEKKFARFIHSLRSTGCKATVVVVTNSSFDKGYKQKYEDCNVEFFFMNQTAATADFYPNSLRYIGYQQFFKANKSRQFNRVLHADAFDVFFQKDPFDEQIHNDRLYFALEDIPIRDSKWNSGWLTRAYNKSIATKLGNNTVSCSGTVIGGYLPFLKYLDVLLNHPQFWKNGRDTLVQAYHNYLLYTSAFTASQIKYSFLGCNSQILTMHYCSRSSSLTIKHNHIYSPNGQLEPSIVHQYPVYQQAINAINSLCPK